MTISSQPQPSLFTRCAELLRQTLLFEVQPFIYDCGNVEIVIAGAEQVSKSKGLLFDM